MSEKIPLTEQQPWNLSYRMSLEAKPSWSRHGMPALYEEFLKLVKDNGDEGIHLDIGCGDGVKTVNFALASLNTIGIDISNTGFREARDFIKELGVSKICKVIKASCLKLPFKSSSVHSASDILCFTHLKPKDYESYKRQLYRVLKRGGYVLMVLFSDKDSHFHGHKVSKRYTFNFDPANPLMECYAHYHGMYNAHFGKRDIQKTFGDKFEIVKMEKVKHPLYLHRFLWNVILRKHVTDNESKTG